MTITHAANTRLLSGGCNNIVKVTVCLLLALLPTTTCPIAAAHTFPSFSRRRYRNSILSLIEELCSENHNVVRPPLFVVGRYIIIIKTTSRRPTARRVGNEKIIIIKIYKITACVNTHVLSDPKLHARTKYIICTHSLNRATSAGVVL